MACSDDEMRYQLLTPRGMGAIAVVRISGSGAWVQTRQLVRTTSGELPAEAESNRVYFGAFRDADGFVDEVLVAARADALTGLPCVDVSCHGGRRVVERVLLALRDRGASFAEFPVIGHRVTDWRRIVEDRADICLAQATTQRGIRFLLWQRTVLVDALAEVISLAEHGDVAQAHGKLRSLLAVSRGAHRFHEPAIVALVGQPNAGKSSLANRIAGRDAALVADQAGTTRDWVTLSAAVSGVPLTLIDTAGHRDATENLERQAIDRGTRAAMRADVVVRVVDANQYGGVPAIDRPAGHQTPSRLIAFNKIDLFATCSVDSILAPEGVTAVRVSARTGEGLDKLLTELLRNLEVPLEHESRIKPAVFDRAIRDRLRAYLDRPEQEPAKAAAAMVAAITGAPNPGPIGPIPGL